MALDVDAAPAGPPGELGVLPRRDVGVRLAVPLDELLEHHRAGRHVDAQRQGLGGEDDLDQAADEQLLDDLLERRQHPGVVGGDAALEAVEPLAVAEDVQVLVGDARGALLDERADLGALRRRRSAAGRRAGTAVTAASQPARLKMNMIAGSRPSGSSRSTTSERLGRFGRRLPWPRAPARPRGAPCLERRSEVRDERQSSRARRSSSGLTRTSSRASPPGRRTGRTSAGRPARAATAAPGGAPRRSPSVSPRTVSSQSPNSSALDTVADSDTSVTDSGRWMITSSHTAPRNRSAR